jgi:ABC-2 type transport system ATP-binding protein
VQPQLPAISRIAIRVRASPAGAALSWYGSRTRRPADGTDAGRGLAVQLEAVGKRYGLRQPWIVRDVSRQIAAGQLVRLEGSNGSGKSTLLRVMAGVSTPSAGRVTGRPRAGYVPERFPAALAFSAREYLTHMGRFHGLQAAAVPAAVTEWLDRLGATDYAGSPLRTLSKGMCQKVAIAQALMSRPGLLLLDEAWTGLDQAARGALDAAVSERLAAGGTVVFVDHDPARLAGQVSERWRLGSGTVEVLAGQQVTPANAAAGQMAPLHGPVAAGSVLVLEVDGIEAGSLGQLAALPGVLSVSPWPPPEDVLVGRVTASVTGRECDAVLRQLLSWDGVHVAAVRPDEGVAR